MKKSPTLCCILSCCFAASAMAQTIIFDLSTPTGPAQAGAVNITTPESNDGQTTASGTDIGTGITLDVFSGSLGDLISRNRAPFALTPEPAVTLADTFIDQFVRVDSITISGLDAASDYQVQLIFYNDDNTTTGKSVSFTDVTDSRSDALGTIAIPDGGTLLTTNSDFSIFSTITSSAIGEIDIDLSSNNGAPLLNGVVVTTIPEPSVYAMILGGLILGGVAIRRHRNS